MKIVVADDAGNEYDVEAPEGASIAYAVQKASRDLGFRVKHVEKPPLPDDNELLASTLKHTEHQLRMEIDARVRAERAVERETMKREKAEDALEDAKDKLEKSREKEAQTEKARAEAAGKLVGMARALATAESALAGMNGMISEAESRYASMLQSAQDTAKRALESEIRAREESEKRCTALMGELKKPVTVSPRPKGYVIEIDGVDEERPKRRARLKPE